MAISGWTRLPRLVVTYWWQLGLALGIPLIAAVAAEAYFGYRAQLEQIKHGQSVESGALAAVVESNLQREVRFLTRVYGIDWPHDRLRHLAEELEFGMSLFPSIIEATVRDDGGERLFVSQLEARRVGPDVAAERRPPADGAIRFEASHVGPRKIPAIIVTLPHPARARETLSVALDFRTVSDALAQAGRRDSSTLYVLGGDRRVLAHSDAALAVSALDFGSLPHIAAAQSDKDAAARGFSMESHDASGTPVLATVRNVPDTDWLVVVQRPMSQVIAPIRAEATRTLLLLALGLASALILSAGLARRLTSPILHLRRDVERIGQGELAHRSSVRTGDEIQQLAEQVNEMAARLQDYTHGLEAKVEEKTAKLQEAMRARALFLAAASHDLRQPLYAISILADTISLESLPNHARETLAKQREAIAVLRGLFDNLLDLSRFDSGDIRVNPRKVGLREILNPIAVEHEVVSRAKGLAWHCEIADVWVETDPELIRRVVANLLSNAVRYTSEGSVSFTARERDGHIEILVSDTGLGIDPKDQGRIFEEFVQLDNPSRERDRGVGLGLSIVRKITDLLGANLRLRSAPGKGTDISFEIPIAERPAIAPQTAEAEGDGSQLAGMRVWIVEDDPLVRDALQAQFAAWDVDYAFAANRAEVEVLRESDGDWPDAAILDDMLGRGERGLDIAKWLEGNMPSRRIVIVSGNVEPSAAERLRASGFTVLRKPLSSAVLAQWLHGALRVRAAATAAPAAAPAG